MSKPNLQAVTTGLLTVASVLSALLAIYVVIVRIDNRALEYEVAIATREKEEVLAKYAPAVGSLKMCEEFVLQVSDLSRALRTVGSRAYDRETYNCYDHSKDLQTLLAESEIESSIFINRGRTHAWVAVWVEANTGQFISPDNSFYPLEIRDAELNVICSNYR